MNIKADIRIYPDPTSLEDAVAQHFLLAVNQAVQQRERALVALSGGHTPLGLFKLLSNDVYRKMLPWTQIHFFWVDERCVPETDAESNYGQFKSKVLDPLKIAPSQIHPMNGNLHPDQAAQVYNSELRALAGSDQNWPRFDWVLLGMGTDGHTASLFPYKSVDLQNDQAVIAVQAEYDGRPAQRVTLTPVILNEARQLVFMVSGHAKAATLREVIQGPSDPVRLPAQRIRLLDGRLVWMLDEAAASQL